MKTNTLILGAIALTTQVGFSQVLGTYEFYGNDEDSRGNMITDAAQSQSLSPTYVTKGCVEFSKITPVANKYTPHPRSWSTGTYDSSTGGYVRSQGTGISGNHADCFSGWSSSFSKERTIRFDVTFAQDAVGRLDGISFDIGNYGNFSDPNQFKLVVLRDGNEIYESGSQGITNRWASKSFNLSQSSSSDAFKVTAGQPTTYTFMIGAYGNDVTSSGMIALDNIQVFGDHTCVPEPSSAALLGLAGAFVTLRRRR